MIGRRYARRRTTEDEIRVQNAPHELQRVGPATRLVEILDFEALRQDLAVHGHEAGLAGVT